MIYETIFTNNTSINKELAFKVILKEDAKQQNKIKAWSYLIGTSIIWTSDETYIKVARRLIEMGYITCTGIVDWSETNKLSIKDMEVKV